MSLNNRKNAVPRMVVSTILILSFIVTNSMTAVAALTPQTIRSASALTKYTTDLTQLGREGRLRENLSVEAEALRLADTLGEGGVRQPVIIDETRDSQNAIVEQLALGIAKGTFTGKLSGAAVLQLDSATLFSNAKTETDAANAIIAVLDEASATDAFTVVFVDNISNIIAIRPAAEKLFEQLGSGKLAVIGGSNAADFQKNIEARSDVAKYFQPMFLTGNSASAADVKPAGVRDDIPFRGDSVSADIRQMMADDPTGNTRIEAIVQAKSVDDPALRSILADGSAKVTGRIGRSDTIVVNLPLATIEQLATSGTIN